MAAAQDSTEETLPRREREKAAHRKEIVDAAIRVFARKGFAAATLDDIAREAEFSKGALYLHFPGKEDLLFTIFSDMLENTVIKGLRTILAGTRSFREELHDVFKGAAEFAFSHRDQMKISMTLHVSGFSGLSEDSRKKLFVYHEELIETLRSRVRKARDDGEIRDFPLEATVWIIHGALDSMASTRWELCSVRELKLAGKIFVDILFEGIERKKELEP